MPAYFHPEAKDLIEKLLVVDVAKRLGGTRGGGAEECPSVEVRHGSIPVSVSPGNRSVVGEYGGAAAFTKGGVSAIYCQCSVDGTGSGT
ncbi:hypothetical protein, partial [Shinella sp.]|uniref:hypothetical protein n=1 Tax=Shinella sp. TaxID=1870904 RepID=UPI003F70149C